LPNPIEEFLFGAQTCKFFKQLTVSQDQPDWAPPLFLHLWTPHPDLLVIGKLSNPEPDLA
jgi:hypothetical protein